MHPIVDLHCDLLYYLSQNASRTPFDPSPRCSYPQLKAGNVKLQLLALYAETHPKSDGWKQVELFDELLKKYAEQFSYFQGEFTDKVQLLPAIENASTFCNEEEPLKEGLHRLQLLIKKIGKPVYIGLTWNGENRFGGGIGSKAGLKADGLELLRWLDRNNRKNWEFDKETPQNSDLERATIAREQGASEDQNFEAKSTLSKTNSSGCFGLDQKGVAIDFSHASDKLCDDLINAIDKYGLKLRIMASHCNFRAILDHPRNLTDEVAKEIMRRKGIIGIVFYKKFVHPTDYKMVLKHIEHGFKLGGEKSLCFGADYFSLDDPFQSPVELAGFFDELSDSSKYPYLVKLLESQYSEQQVLNISSQNGLNFIKLNRDG